MMICEGGARGVWNRVENEERVADLIGGAAAAILVLVVRVLEVVPLGVIECAHRNTVG